MEALLQELFLKVLNMSITASYVVLVVMFARVFLKKIPKAFSYALWSVVFFRLISPFSFTSVLSLFRFIKKENMQHISPDIGMMTQPKVNIGSNAMDYMINSVLPAANPIASVNPMQLILFVASVIWLSGILVMSIYTIVNYMLLRKKVAQAIRIKEIIYECENITSAFVMGIIKPKIYIATGFSETEKSHILQHEHTHIKHFDHIIKLIAFLILCIHWFNPLVWMGFIVMNKDMEMCCDEAVLKQLGGDIKKEYSNSLLSVAVRTKVIGANQLFFGESNTKSRIKNVLSYKKPSFWVLLIGFIAITFIALGLISNPKSSMQESSFLDIKDVVSKTTQKESLENPSQISKLVEENLTVIMSLPKQSSNPEDYIKANSNASENILKYGEDALSYMLTQFESGNAEGLRGQIMMRLCIELLGSRNNVTDKSLSSMEWFSQLQIRQKVDLPDFKYTGNDAIQKLVYETEVQRNTAKHGEFTIFAPHIFGSYEEDNKLKIFVTIYSQSYILYDKTLSDEGGSVVPAAITYVKNTDGSYTLEKYEQAQDGSFFAPSIEHYCVMPVSGKKINGLYDKIISHYKNYGDILNLERENLIQHLKANNQDHVNLYQKQYQKEDELLPIT